MAQSNEMGATLIIDAIPDREKGANSKGKGNGKKKEEEQNEEEE